VNCVEYVSAADPFMIQKWQRRSL